MDILELELAILSNPGNDGFVFLVILQKKDELKINDTVFLEMLEKKYPFVSN